MKRYILLVILMLSFLCSCDKNEPEPIAEPVSVTVMADTNENLPLWSYIREASGMEITVLPMPNDRICEALLLEQSADKLPDVVYLKSSEDLNALAECELLVDLREHMDKLPQYERATFVNEVSDELLYRHCAADGGAYVLPALGVMSSERAWLYRADVFGELNLSVPNTMQELSEAALAIKRAHPDSTPIGLRDGFYGLDLVAPAWKADASLGAYYDFEREKWTYGAIESWMGNFVSFWSNLYKNGLLPTGYLSMSSAQIDAEIERNHIFIIPDYVWRLEQFKTKYPQQEWRIMPAPKAGTEDAQHKIAKRETAFSGYAICKKSDADISDSLKFLDWMYSSEAAQILSWGKENESYTEYQLQKKLILNQGESARERYGIGTDGLCTQLLPQAEINLVSNERINNSALARIYTERYINPIRYLTLTEEEYESVWFAQKRLDLVYTAGVTEFLTGRWPMEHWEAFVDSLGDEDISRILNVYADAYKRVCE